MKKALLTLLLTLSITSASANDFLDDVENIVGSNPEVNINLGTGLINTILAFAGEDEDTKEAADVLSGLSKVKISVFDISNNKNTKKLTSLIKSKISKLTSQGYEQIVTVREDDELVHIVAKVDGQLLEDAMIIVMDAEDELVVLSLDGDINLKQLAQLSDEFDVDLDDILDT